MSRLLRSWEEPDDMNNDLQDKVEQAEDVHDEAAAEAVVIALVIASTMTC